VQVMKMGLCKVVIVLLCTSSTILCEDIPDFYTFTTTDIKGNEVNLEKYRGKVSLVVNVASQCGYTDSHYKSMKRLHDILSFKGKFNVLAFPCNQFEEQEPWEENVIEEFATSEYGVEFPMFSKIDVLGEDAAPAFKSLIDQSSVTPDWNFFKYLVDHNGKVLQVWNTKQTIENVFDDIKAAVDTAEELADQEPDADGKKDEL